MSDDAERFYELHDDIMREARAYEDAAATIASAQAGITQWPQIATS